MRNKEFSAYYKKKKQRILGLNVCPLRFHSAFLWRVSYMGIPNIGIVYQSLDPSYLSFYFGKALNLFFVDWLDNLKSE